MNYLAHIYLAQYSDDAMLGALLGDFVKPHAGLVFAPDVEAEILTHRKVDSFTDSHRLVLAAKQLFDGPSRRYAGILLDVFYDHLLARRWTQYSDTPLDAFIGRFYAVLARHAQSGSLPASLARITPYMIGQDWLGSYADFSGVQIAITRMSSRLSRNGNLLRDGLVNLETHYAALARGFDAFFPELIAFVAKRRA